MVQNPPREIDGFRLGTYEFTIDVLAETGQSVTAKFRVNITRNIRDIFLERIE